MTTGSKKVIRYAMLELFCDVDQSEPDALRARIGALSDFFHEYDPVHWKMLAETMKMIPDHRTLPTRALIERARQLAAVLDITPEASAPAQVPPV